jgi:hypothetical protein
MSYNYTLILLTASLITSFNTSAQQCSFNTTAPAGAPATFHSFNSNAEGFTGNITYDAGAQSLFTTSGSGVRTVTTPAYNLTAGQTSIVVRISLDRSASNSITAYRVTANTVSNLYTLCPSQTLSPAISPTIGTPYYLTIPIPANTLTSNASFQLNIHLTQTGSFRVDNIGLNAAFVGGVLPVSFIGFEGKRSAGGVALTWKVGLEENAKRYEVEKSLDGQNYFPIGFVPVAGLAAYLFVDAMLPQVAYYRIKGVDIDGKFTYSTVAYFKNGSSSGELKAFPMPAARTLTVQHSNANATSALHLFTQGGVLLGSIKPGFNAQQTVLDLSFVRPGLYLVRFDDGKGNIETLKVIKQ